MTTDGGGADGSSRPRRRSLDLSPFGQRDLQARSLQAHIARFGLDRLGRVQGDAHAQRPVPDHRIIGQPGPSPPAY